MTTEHPFRTAVMEVIADNDQRIDLQIKLGLTPRFAGDAEKAIVRAAMLQLADMANEELDFASVMTAFQIAFASAIASVCANVAANLHAFDEVDLTDELATRVKRSAIKAANGAVG